MDSKENVYAVGYTQSSANIATSGAHQDSYAGSTDAVLVKFDKAGTRLWATYYGGSNSDFGYAIVVFKGDSVIIGGKTRSSSGIATSDAYQTTYRGGGGDGFATKFAPDGSRIWGTYYGGDNYDDIVDIALDSSYNILFAGNTASLDYIATEGSYQDYKEGDYDAFLVKFDSAMNRQWATYFGGPDPQGYDKCSALACDRAGDAFLAGYTPNTYSIANNKGFQEDYGGGAYDAFLVKFYPNGDVHWSTYYGGSDVDRANDVAVYGNGKVYLLGTTKSDDNIATDTSFQNSRSGDWDAFVAKFDIYGDRLWSSYYGGTGSDYGVSIAKYGFNECAFLLHTDSDDIATETNLQNERGGEEDALVVRFDGYGNRKWASYYGGLRTERTLNGGIVSSSSGNIVIAGATKSYDRIASENSHQDYYIGDSLANVDKDTGDTTWAYMYDAFAASIGVRIKIQNFPSRYCSGASIRVPFSLGLDFNPDNEFILELSDSAGDFSTPYQLGTLNDYKGGHIDGVIDTTIPPGIGYRVRIRATSPPNVSSDNGFDIIIDSLPSPIITGDSIACSRNNLFYYVSAQPGFSSLWKIEGGRIVGDTVTNNVEIVWEDVEEGRLTVIQTIDETGCVDSTSYDVTIISSPVPTISGDTSVAAFSSEFYSAPSRNLTKYEWTVSGGSIAGDSSGSRILVNWLGAGIGYVKVKMTDERTMCSDTARVNVVVNSSPLTIIGKKTVCANSVETYRIIADTGSVFKWFVNGGEIDGSDSKDSVSILWGEEGEGFLKVAISDSADSKRDTALLRVNILPAPKPRILGANEVCESSVEKYVASYDENETIRWFVANGEILAGETSDTVTIQWNDIPSYEDTTNIVGVLTLEAKNLETECVGTKQMNVYVSKNPEAKFKGSLSVCSGKVETYEAEDTSALSNEWQVSGGSIIGASNENVLQVEWGEPGVGKIKLIQTNANLCVDSNETNVKINPVPERPTITQSGKVLISSSETGNQWYFNGKKIPDATNQFLMPDSTGYYTVTVTNSAGCESQSSEPFYFDLTDVAESSPSPTRVFVYPNPAASEIAVKLESSETRRAVSAKIEIFDALGKLIAKKRESASKTILAEFDVHGYPAGEYIVKISLGTSVYFSRFVKR